MRNVDRLCLAHLWVAFGAFAGAAALGTWQMWVRSPLGAHTGTPGAYYMSVTAHGVAMAYVLSTFFIMAFGYFVAVTALHRPLPGKGWAWTAFVVGVIGVGMTLVTIALGKSSVVDDGTLNPTLCCRGERLEDALVAHAKDGNIGRLRQFCDSAVASATQHGRIIRVDRKYRPGKPDPV